MQWGPSYFHIGFVAHGLSHHSGKQAFTPRSFSWFTPLLVTSTLTNHDLHCLFPLAPLTKSAWTKTTTTTTTTQGFPNNEEEVGKFSSEQGAGLTTHPCYFDTAPTATTTTRATKGQHDDHGSAAVVPRVRGSPIHHHHALLRLARAQHGADLPVVGQLGQLLRDGQDDAVLPRHHLSLQLRSGVQQRGPTHVRRQQNLRRPDILPGLAIRRTRRHPSHVRHEPAAVAQLPVSRGRAVPGAQRQPPLGRLFLYLTRGNLNGSHQRPSRGWRRRQRAPLDRGRRPRARGGYRVGHPGILGAVAAAAAAGERRSRDGQGRAVVLVVIARRGITRE